MLRRAAISATKPFSGAVLGGRGLVRGTATSTWEGWNDENSSASLTTKERKEAQSPRSEEEIAKAKAAAVEMLSESHRDENIAKMKKKRAEKTIAELDEELRLKLEGISGEGGDAGVEYEGGKAVGLKRGVRENMFRVI